MKKLKLFFALFAMLALNVGNAWAEDYELVSFSDIQTNDVIIIVGTKSNKAYAMTNDKGTSSAPVPSLVTISNNKISSTATNITFTATKNSDGTLTFTANGNNKLYCTNTNNGVRVGTNSNNKFSFDTSVKRLKNEGAGRWLGIYNTQDWRCYNTASATNISGTTTTFYKKVVTAVAYTITAQSNDASYGAVSVDGTTIKATPNAGYCVKSGDDGYTVISGTASVTNNGNNTFTVTPETDCTIQINFESLPTYSVAWVVNGETKETKTYTSGDALVLPTYTPTAADCDDVKTFAGWTATEITGVSETKPTDLFKTASGTVASTATYYAVFEGEEGGSATSTTADKLTQSWTGITGTSYSNWTGITLESSAVYAGNSAGGNSSIQLRSSNSNSGIVTTVSGGKAKKVVVEWNSNTDNARKIDIYGKNSAYSQATDLYNSTNQGTKIGTLQKGTSELIISDAYEYIGIRSNSGALYLTSITITWETGGPTKNYATTCEAVAVKAPTFSVEEGEFSQAFSLTLTQENGKDIYYRLNDDASFTKYTAAISIPAATTTVHAYAKDGENESATVSATYTYIKPIETLEELKAKGAGTYDFTLTNAVVTYVKSDNKKVYIEDATTGMYIYNVTTHGLEAGKKYTGSMSGTLSVFNKLNELTAFTLGSDVTDQTAAIPVTELTIAELLANFARYESVRVKVTGTVSAFESRKATLTDGSSSIQLYDDNSLSLSTTANDIVTVVGYPGLYNSEKQLKIMTAEDLQKQEVEKYTVTGAVNPAEAGSVSIATAELAATQTTTVTATANTGYTFASWSVSGTGATLSSTTANPSTLTMGSEDATITASFTAIPQVTL